MTDYDQLSKQSATAIGRALAAGLADPVALTQHYLSQIEAQTSPVFLRVTAERALSEARESRKRLQAGRPLSPLDGVPVAWKDLFDMQGEVTTAGSELRRSAEPAQADAAVVANARAAGIVSVGKVNLTEFAYSGLGLNPHYGTPVNSFGKDVPRAPGGSSSGSGVAVATNLCPCAIGTDTGGSVRIPSAFNGLVGYKSSEGRINRTGVFALSRTHDTIGPLARSVEDCVLLDRVLRGVVGTQVFRGQLSGAPLYVPDAIVLDDLDPGVAENFERSIGILEKTGMRVQTGLSDIFADTAQLLADNGTITGADAYAEHRDLVDGSDCEQMDRRVVARIMMGKRMSAADLVALQRGRSQLLATMAERCDGLIAMPTVALVAPPIAPLDADDDLYHRTNLKALRNTALGNFLDLPGLAIPNGTDDAGMPTSLLISTPSGRDELLFSLGLEVERVLNLSMNQGKGTIQ